MHSIYLKTIIDLKVGKIFLFSFQKLYNFVLYQMYMIHFELIFLCGIVQRVNVIDLVLQLFSKLFTLQSGELAVFFSLSQLFFICFEIRLFLSHRRIGEFAAFSIFYNSLYEIKIISQNGEIRCFSSLGLLVLCVCINVDLILIFRK